MYRNSVEAPRRPATRTKAGRAARLALLLCLAAPAAARAQSNAFNSGSTGADGAFAPTASQTITVPESGVFNFTTVNIPTGVNITFARNSKNTPVTILASGNITILGQITVSGQANNAYSNNNGSGGLGGPGGFNGGNGGCPGDPANFAGDTGDGPGGGIGGASNGTDAGGGGGGGFSDAGGNGLREQLGGQGGPRYGASNLLPLVGGSGGGGGGNLSSENRCGSGGGGGGGAILIASSGSISFSTSYHTGIDARGGNALTGPTGGGGGAGGAIRLVANVISGLGALSVNGGYSFTANGDAPFRGGGRGAAGYARVEAYDYRNFSDGGGNTIIFALPNPVTPPTAPRLRIVSVAGVAAPAAPLGALHSPPDIVLPTARTSPVEVVVEANNITVGTMLSVTVTPERGARTTVQSGGLTGTEASSTARASVSLPTGVSVVSATAVVDLTTSNARPLFIDGERVTRLEVAATFGGASEVTYVTSTGRRVKKSAE